MLPDGLPSRYVRLVYCLGYGESEICSRAPQDNSGTWQYWDIFGQVARGEDQPRKGSHPLVVRLRRKLSVLSALRDRGIWLQDASPLGIYLGQRKRVDHALQAELMRAGYERFVWPSVANDKPKKVWVIGTGVASALAGLPGIPSERVITQPQDRVPGRHRQGLVQMAEDLRHLEAPIDLG
jgi:hypothetical protein